MSQSLTQLTPNLWVAQSTLYLTNSGIFLDQGQACLIDPGIFPKEISAISNFVTEQDVELQAIVLTHGHWDHILGPEHFPGSKTVAQANYLAEVSGKPGRHIRQQIEELEASHNIERAQPFVIPHPDETFDETRSLTVGSLSLRLKHAPGHAADQLVVYQADTGTLWAADMLSDVEIPFVSHNLAAYERTLAMLSTLDIRVLVPGHGHATMDLAEIRGRFADDMDYLAGLRDKIEGAIREGRPVTETVALCTDMRYRYPEDNERPHRLNIESLYIELGGKAESLKIGWDNE